jgi:hypothetical protein
MPTLECLHALPVTRSPGMIVVLHCQDKLASTTKITRKWGHSFVTSVRIMGARCVESGSSTAVSLEAAKDSYSVEAVPFRTHARSLPWPRWAHIGGNTQIAAMDYSNWGMISRRFAATVASARVGTPSLARIAAT